MKKDFFFSFKGPSSTAVIFLEIIGLFSVFSFVFAVTPVPGHPWNQVGDGLWGATGTTAYRTFTFPDADATVLTTASLVGVSQGGTGASATSTALNTLTGFFAKGDTAVYGGSSVGRLPVGVNSAMLLASSTSALGVVWGGVLPTPAGTNGQLQYNDLSSFGATTSLSFSKASSTFGLNGYIDLLSVSDPASPSTTTLKLYNRTTSGRSLLKSLANFGVNYPLQPSLFQTSLFYLTTGAGTAISVYGNQASSTGTISHVVSEPLGYMINQVTATAASSTAGTFASTSQFLRGTQAGSSGFFFKARVAYVTATSTGYISFVGLTSGGGMLPGTNLNPAGSHIGFQFSTQRGDVVWNFMTKDGTTRTVTPTTVIFTLNNVYDMYIYSPAYPNESVLYYRIDDVTAGTTYEATTSLTLPAGGTFLRPGYVIGNTNVTGARNIRAAYVYTESGR